MIFPKTYYLRMQMVSAFLAFCLFITACGKPAPGSPTSTPTQPSAVAQTQLPAPANTPTEAAAPTPTADKDTPISGGSVTVWLPSEPRILSSLMAPGTMAEVISGFIVEGLLARNPQREFVPVLAETLPEISQDGLVLTYHLKRGVKFSNGDPFSCADVQFTWKAVMSRLSPYSKAGYERIKTVDCPDEATAVITFSVGYYNVLQLFSLIIPKSAGPLEKIPGWDYNSAPIGTGPWMLSEWEISDHILLAPNPYYHESGKPHLGQIVLKFMPGVSDALGRLKKGDIDILWNLGEGNLQAIQNLTSDGIRFSAVQSGSMEMLLLNLADPTKFAPSDASASPHPILSDIKVRQAIRFAIDKQSILKKLFVDQVKASSSPISEGLFDCSIQPDEYNLEKAKTLLEEAGWKIGADGIREKNGIRLSLKVTADAENQSRALIETDLVENLKAAGIELKAENKPRKAYYAGWSEQGFRVLGQYDLMFDASEATTNPAASIRLDFLSTLIPSVGNGGKGANYARYKNQQVDEWINTLIDTSNLETQRQLYCQIASQVNQDVPAIYLYEHLSVSAYRSRLHNFSMAPGLAGITFGSQNWWVSP